jgi:peroxiredoxin
MGGWLAAILVVLLGLVLVSQIGLWAVLYQVVRQQGRLLLRLDELARRSVPAPLGAESSAAETNGQSVQPAAPIGLPAGTIPLPFRLPDLTGRLVGLEDFRGQRALLIHWNPDCGFCDLIAPDLARMQADLQRRQVPLVLVSSGTAEANRRLAEQHGLACPLLLKEAAGALDLFGNLGTPVAYLLDEQGRIAQPLAVGADEVVHLAQSLLTEPETAQKRLPGERPLSESRIEREGLKAGTQAPAFLLPDVHGGTVTLEQYRGRRVLLVFADPHCGPCDALAPHLARLQREHAGELTLLMVSRGQVEENRQKAEQAGLTFPVALQKRWEISKAYGIFATPVAFLIDEQGVLMRDVAKGGEAILALAQEGLASGAGKEPISGRVVR